MKRLTTILMAATLAGCSSATAPGNQATFDLALHQGAVAPGTSLLVRFDSVAQDGRCPIGAMCIWEGKASVVLSVAAGGAASRLQLTSTPDSATRMAFGWFVDYLDLMPHPAIGEPPAGAPIVRLRVRPALD